MFDTFYNTTETLGGQQLLEQANDICSQACKSRGVVALLVHSLKIKVILDTILYAMAKIVREGTFLLGVGGGGGGGGGWAGAFWVYCLF